MKKTLSIIVVIALSISLLSGCGAKQEKPAEPAATAEPAETSSLAGLPNPVIEYASAQEQIQAVGLALEAPEGATDVQYLSILDMAETLFTLDGVKYCYRAQPTAELESYDMSGLYYTFDEPVSGAVLRRDAKAFIGQGVGFVQWLDIVPGVNYNLSAETEITADKLFEVAELVFVPTQGDVDGEVPELSGTPLNYAGTFNDGNPAEGCETIVFTPLEDGTFGVDLSIFRLSQFPGTGSIMDAAVEMVLTDPNGGEMCAIFFPAEDGTFTLRITQSTWSLLPEGEEFTGFVPAE